MTDLQIREKGQNRQKSAPEIAVRLLNAKPKISRDILALDRGRARIGLSHIELCRRAGISTTTWEDLRAGRRVARKRTLRNLKSVITSGGGMVRVRRARAALYYSVLAIVCAELGHDLAVVVATSHYPARTSDPEWRRASEARSITIYLCNCTVGVRQGEIAKLLGMTPAAVSIAISRVEDRRDDNGFDDDLARFERMITGETA